MSRVSFLRGCALGGLLGGLAACTAPVPNSRPADSTTAGARGPTTLAAPAVTRGVDSVKIGDTLRLSYWRTTVVVDSVRYRRPTAPSIVTGIPITVSGADLAALPPYISTGLEGVTPKSIVDELALLTARKTRCAMLNMTGGAHTRYMTNGSFDRKKWNDTMAAYNTTAIKTAVAAAVKNGVICGNSVMDEPQVCGAGDGNTWGRCGLLTKLRVDSLCAAVKTMFPTLPVGVVHGWDRFDLAHSYKQCDFVVSMYSSRLGNLDQWIAGALAMGKRDGVQLVLGMNILNGGTQTTKARWPDGCPKVSGAGTYTPNCRMSPDQVRTYGPKLLAKTTGAFSIWRFDREYFADATKLAALKTIAEVGARLPFTPLRRRLS